MYDLLRAVVDAYATAAPEVADPLRDAAGCVLEAILADARTPAVTPARAAETP